MSKAESWTILDTLRWTTGYLEGKGVPTPRLDAEVLLAWSLGVDRVRLYLDFERPLCPPELARYRELVRRRAKREPVAYIRGFKEFWSLEFDVTPAVLIPRPETEVLVEEALKLARALSPKRPAALRVADVGTGSGAVAVVLARELNQPVLATDASPEALEVARRNAHKHKAEVEFIRGDLLAPFADHSLDLVVSNPPYVPRAEVLHPAVPELGFEPRGALEGGEDGLDALRRLASDAPRVLASGGWLVLEVGAGQATDTARLLEAAGLRGVARVSDLAGIERVVKGRRG